MSDPDRRADARIHPAGTAKILRRGAIDELAIRDLSAKGVRLVGNARFVEGERVKVSFVLDGVELVLDARVQRTEPQRAQVALELLAVPRDAAVAIARTIAQLRQSTASAARVVICHPDADTRAAIERDVLRLGRLATLCASVADARAAIERGPVSAILLASGLAGLLELVDELVAAHPTTKRVLMFGEQLESIEHGLASRIDAVLRMPPRIRPLARALGIDTNDSSLALLLPDDPPG